MKISVNYHRPSPRYQDPAALDALYPLVRQAVSLIDGAESFIEVIRIGFTHSTDEVYVGQVRVTVVVSGEGLGRHELDLKGHDFETPQVGASNLMRHLRFLSVEKRGELDDRRKAVLAFEQVTSPS